MILADDPPAAANPAPQSSRPRIPEKSQPNNNGDNNNQQQATTTTEDPNAGKSGKKPKKGGSACFHGSDIVVTDQGKMTMTDLVANKDARVLTKGADGQLEYSSVYYWIHAQSEVETEYITLSTESGHNLPITGKHLIYQTDCKGNSETIFADKVQIGKCLQVNDNGDLIESKVISKSKDMKKGVYAPITTNGNIIVNDVLASCFTNVENEAVQKIIYSYVSYGHSMLTSVLPNSFVDLFYSNQSGSMVQIPEIVLSFLDLSKGFFKL